MRWVEEVVTVGVIVMLLVGERREGLTLVCVVGLVLGFWHMGRREWGDVMVEDGMTEGVGIMMVMLLVWALGGVEEGEGWLIVVMGLGGLMIVSAGNMLMLYLSIELQGIATYVLIGRRRTAESLEGALKYYIVGGLATGMMAYGWV